MGNIVRSPLAEALFRQRAEQRGLDRRFLADSAGTSGYHVGELPDRRMRETAAAHGLEYTGSSRQVTIQDLAEADLVLALDDFNYADLQGLAEEGGVQPRLRWLREFDPENDGATQVPDPYYGEQAGFEATFAIISRSVDGLLDYLESAEE